MVSGFWPTFRLGLSVSGGFGGGLAGHLAGAGFGSWGETVTWTHGGPFGFSWHVELKRWEWLNIAARLAGLPQHQHSAASYIRGCPWSTAVFVYVSAI